MYLREALIQSSSLLTEVASVYERLARDFAPTPQVAAERAESARKETARARLLFALAELSTAAGDDGPFVTEIPVCLARLRHALCVITRRLSRGADPNTDKACIDTLEAAGLESFHAEILEAAEPEMTRVLRMMDSEISHSRHVLHSVRSRRRRTAAAA